MALSVLELTADLAELTLSSKKPLTDYFPPNLKIYEFNAGEDKVSKEVSLNEISEWLRCKENSSFVFQCLLCFQEMTFCTAFNRGDYIYNRSHMLTIKHKKRVINNGSLVGLLFNSPQKFVLCSERDFKVSNIFEIMKRVSRRDIPLLNPKILNQVSCKQYKMYSFDRKTKQLSELETEDDMVLFMKGEVRPLFTMYCLFCDQQGVTYTQVVQHLNSRRHKKKIGVEKGAVLAVKDFNIFITCSFNKLSSLMYLTHLNSYLEEIVVAGDGSIIVSGFHSKDGKADPKKDIGISVNVHPITLPNGLAKNESVRIRTCFHNFIEDNEDLNRNDKAISRSNELSQKNVTIYEFSNSTFREYYADNLLFSLFSSGCRIWCTRCSLPIYTLEALENHLGSQQHAVKVRNNEQVGFMCHVCNVFYIELKGARLAHIHSSKQNKSIIALLDLTKKEALQFNTLRASLIRVYSHLFEELSEPYKFCCLLCSDLSKKKLLYLEQHEMEEAHKAGEGTIMFAFCSFCKVLYLHKNSDDEPPHFFREHFSTHSSPGLPVFFQVYSSTGGHPYELSADQSTLDLSKVDVGLLPVKENTKIQVRWCLYLSQHAHPAISCDELSQPQDWAVHDLLRFAAFASSSSLFTCLHCQKHNMTKADFSNHMFSNNHHSSVSFIKYCDICNEILVACDAQKLQEHFNSRQHINKLLVNTSISLDEACVQHGVWTDIASLFCSKSSLQALSRKLLGEMKEVQAESNVIFTKIERDLKGLLPIPELSVQLYGSQLAGLALKHNDYDICLNVGFDKFDEVACLLERAQGKFRVLKRLPDTEGPIIKVFHLETQTHCDISFTINGQADSNKLIRVYREYDERVAWMLSMVRHWSTQSKLRGTQALPSPAISWLVLFYLMQPPVSLIPSASHALILIGGVLQLHSQDSKLEWKGKSMCKMSHFELLEGFLHYYSLVDLRAVKLCPLSGLVIPRPKIYEEDTMFLEDPFSQRNLGKRAGSLTCAKLQTLCHFMLSMPWRIN